MFRGINQAPVTVPGWTLLALSLLLSACSGGGGGNGDEEDGSAPIISNLVLVPDSAYLNDGGGSLVVNSSVDFVDSDGDLASYSLTIYDDADNVLDTVSNAIPGIEGITSGTLGLTLVINTGAAGDYPYAVVFRDAAGHSSNTLRGTFSVYGPTPTTSQLPQTGIDRCYNQSAIINCPRGGEAFYGQDFQYASQPMQFVDNSDGTVSDAVTGLMWQQSPSATLYNWYEASGTHDVTHNPGSTDVCGALTLAGHADWRLPGRHELESIVDYGAAAPPAIDSNYFPNGQLALWSLSDEATKARYLDLSDGSLLLADKDVDKSLRCVRGAEWGANSFVDHGDGTVSETAAGLMWQKASQGSSDWQAMPAYCEGLELAGHTDWRLPDIKELATLVGAEAAVPASSGIYCSSSTVKDDPASVWLVQFSAMSNYGDLFSHAAGNSKQTCGSFYYRCVR